MADPAQRCRGSVKAELVEGQLWTAVERILEQPEVIAEEVAKQYGKLGELRTETAREMDLLKTALAKCDREEERWARAYAAEVIEVEEFQQYRAEIEQRRRGLRDRHAELDAALAGAAHMEETVAALSMHCARVRQRVEAYTWEEKRQALEALNIIATYHPNKRLEIHGTIPLEEESFVSSTARCDRSAVCPSRRTRHTSLYRAAR